MKSDTVVEHFSTARGVIDFVVTRTNVAHGWDHCALCSHAGLTLTVCCCVCVRPCRLAAWWIPLFVAQVRRHPWWDRPTVHHSPASASPLLLSPHLHPFSATHSSPAWRMAYTRNVLLDILPFFLRQKLFFTLSFDCFFLFLYLFLLASSPIRMSWKVGG